MLERQATSQPIKLPDRQLDIERDGLGVTPTLHTKTGVAAQRLRSIVERIERLNEERAGISSDIKDIFTEAKSAGFSAPALRAVLKLRKMAKDERDEIDTLVATYMRALEE